MKKEDENNPAAKIQEPKGLKRYQHFFNLPQQKQT